MRKNSATSWPMVTQAANAARARPLRRRGCVHPVAPLQERQSALHPPRRPTEAERELREAHLDVARRVLAHEPIDVVRLHSHAPLDLARIATDGVAVTDQRLDRRLDLLGTVRKVGMPRV